MTQEINLYNPALRQARELLSARNLAVAAALSLMLAVVAIGASSHAHTRARTEAAQAAEALQAVQQRIGAVNARLAAQPVNAGLQREVDAARVLLKSREEVLLALGDVSIEPGRGFAVYLSGLARQSLLGIWLTGIAIGPGKEFSLTGRTLNHALLADYVRRLGSEPAFKGHRFSRLAMARVEQGNTEARPVTARTDSLQQPIEFSLQASPATAEDRGAPATLAATALAAPLRSQP